MFDSSVSDTSGMGITVFKTSASKLSEKDNKTLAANFFN
jgi:hypothetical protein